MSADLDPIGALRQHLGWEAGELSVRPLTAGLTNRSFDVLHDTGRFVLRLDTRFSQGLSLDRERELGALLQAFAAGVGPEVLFAAPEEGVLLTRFVEGPSWSMQDLDDDANVASVCSLLHRVHALPRTGHLFSPAAVARDYSARLVFQEELREFAERCVVVAEACASPSGDEDSRCCHNDVVAQNLLGKPQPLLIDWEYVGDNDPFFDLASLTAYHGMSGALTARWLSAFTGGTRPEHRERLALQRQLYDALHWLWLAVRELEAPSWQQRVSLKQLQASIETR